MKDPLLKFWELLCWKANFYVGFLGMTLNPVSWRATMGLPSLSSRS